MINTASDVMTREIITVPADDSIQEVASVLIENKIGSVGVKKGDDIVGIVTDRDFVRLWALGEKAMKVEDIMSYPPITIDAKTDLLDVVRIMGEKKCEHLFVEEEGNIMGIITLRNIIINIPEYVLGHTISWYR